MPTPRDKRKSSKDRLRGMVDSTVSVLDQKTEQPDAEPEETAHGADAREAKKRNREHGWDIALTSIEPDPNQVRTVDTASAEFHGLVDSVRAHGVLSPITVRWIEARKIYQIVAGERRFRAAREAGLEFIPVVIRDITDTKKSIHQLVENLQREDMNPVEEAKAFHRYLAATESTQAQLASEVGKSASYVSRMMTLLEKLTVDEQEQLTRLAPAQLPGKSLILEALRTEDSETRHAILFGTMTRADARKVLRPKTAGRPKYPSKTIQTDDPPATVTVRLKSSLRDEEAMVRALREAADTLEQQVNESD